MIEFLVFNDSTKLALYATFESVGIGHIIIKELHCFSRKLNRVEHQKLIHTAIVVKFPVPNFMETWKFQEISMPIIQNMETSHLYSQKEYTFCKLHFLGIFMEISRNIRKFMKHL